MHTVFDTTLVLLVGRMLGSRVVRDMQRTYSTGLCIAVEVSTTSITARYRD